MASAFKNAGQANPTTDDATADVYTAPSNARAVLHAVNVSNTAALSAEKVTIKVSVDGGTTFRHIIKNCIIPQNNTFILDKPVKPGDYILRFNVDYSGLCFISYFLALEDSTLRHQNHCHNI